MAVPFISRNFIPAGVMVLLFSITACRKFEPEQLVIIRTGSATEVGPYSSRLNGDILDTGKEGIQEHGFVWSDSENPTADNGQVNRLGVADRAASYTSRATDLRSGTTYYFRAFAVSGGKTTFGSQKSFTTANVYLPNVSTLPPTTIDTARALATGEVTDDGGAPVTARGLCWSTDPSPTLEDAHTEDGTGTGEFRGTMEVLEPYTRYYYRAYATNAAGTAYGGELEFRTLWNGEPVTDFEGNRYSTVQIGGQVWMAENLRSTQYTGGEPIPVMEDPADWSSLEAEGAAYCWPENNPDLGDTYGALYTWAAATHGLESSDEVPSGIQGVCPWGWHLPSDTEWKIMEISLGMDAEQSGYTGWHGTNEGGKLKAEGTGYWISPNTGATNESGFSALPAGFRNPSGDFDEMGASAYFWTSYESDQGGAWFHKLGFDQSGIFRDAHSKVEAYSIRCLKNY